jgi:inner membrane protein
MPSPIGHAIGGLTAGWAAAGRPRVATLVWPALVLCLVGMLPDIDLLFGIHSGQTHSVGAALIVLGAAWVFQRAAPRLLHGLPPLAIGCAYASHILLDWLGQDTSAPHGVMALWPFTDRYFMSPIAFLPSITRRYWLPGFWLHNLRALAFELAVLGPILILVWWSRRPVPSARRDFGASEASRNAR